MVDKDDLITLGINTLFKVNKITEEQEKDYWDRFCKKKINSGKFTELDYFFQKKVYARMHHNFLTIMGNVADKEILEAGCGSGYASILLAQEGAKVTLLDNSQFALEYSKRLCKKLKFRQRIKYILGSVENLPFGENIFDIVHNCGVIEHYDNKIIIKMLREMTRVAKKDGQIMVMIPNLLSPEIVYRMAKFGKGSERYISKRKLRKLMEKANLQDIEIKSANASVIPSCFPEKIHQRFSFLDDKLKFLDYLFYGRGFKKESAWYSD